MVTQVGNFVDGFLPAALHGPDDDFGAFLTHLFQDFFPPFFKQVGGIAALGTLGIAALQQRVQLLQ